MDRLFIRAAKCPQGNALSSRARQRVIPFVLCSLALHLVAMLQFDFSKGKSGQAIDALPPIEAHFAPAKSQSPAESPAEPQQIVRQSSRPVASVAPARDAKVVVEATTSQAQQSIPNAQAGSFIDLEQARSLARTMGRKPPGTGITPEVADSPLLPIEIALAKAFSKRALIERKENDGWIIRDGDRRCLIVPHDIPHFMQGVLIVPLCS